jgi:site-specific DNA-methyltransferase (adenine-specific)
VTPYYADDRVTLYHGDARELLAETPDRTYDAVITDPPYSDRTHTMAASRNTTAPAGGRILTGAHTAFPHIDLPELRRIFGECGRITRRWVVTDLDYRHAVHLEDQPPDGLRVLRIGAWIKTNPMPIFSGDRPAQGWEAVAYMHRTDTKPAWNGGGRAGNYVLPSAQNTGHPTSKPLAMVGDWVRLFTDPGDTILDPFAGSGTTLRAAVDNGRKAVGCELDERYCELTARRLGQLAIDFGGVA